jgi:hypothetical protein
VRFVKRFCSHACGTTWNNRRKTRGAEAYDIVMSMRFDRPNAKMLKAWTLLCRMASQWNHEDQEAGRRSFGTLAEVMDRNVRYNVVRGRVSK